jgi:hypothetical protein
VPGATARCCKPPMHWKPRGCTPTSIRGGAIEAARSPPMHRKPRGSSPSRQLQHSPSRHRRHHRRRSRSHRRRPVRRRRHLVRSAAQRAGRVPLTRCGALSSPLGRGRAAHTHSSANSANMSFGKSSCHVSHPERGGSEGGQRGPLGSPPATCHIQRGGRGGSFGKSSCHVIRPRHQATSSGHVISATSSGEGRHQATSKRGGTSSGSWGRHLRVVGLALVCVLVKVGVVGVGLDLRHVPATSSGARAGEEEVGPGMVVFDRSRERTARARSSTRAI